VELGAGAGAGGAGGAGAGGAGGAGADASFLGGGFHGRLPPDGTVPSGSTTCESAFFLFSAANMALTPPAFGISSSSAIALLIPLLPRAQREEAHRYAGRRAAGAARGQGPPQRALASCPQNRVQRSRALPPSRPAARHSGPPGRLLSTGTHSSKHRGKAVTN